MKELFANDLFLIFYGVVFYYVILWSMAKNAKSKALKERLKNSDSKDETAMVYADEKYKFRFTEWLHDNSDEMIITAMSSLLLIGFDQLAADYVKKTWDVELGKAVFLLGGVAGDMIYRMIAKMRS